MIYNATIDSELQTLDQLLGKSPLLADFKGRENRQMCGVMGRTCTSPQWSWMS